MKVTSASSSSAAEEAKLYDLQPWFVKIPEKQELSWN